MPLSHLRKHRIHDEPSTPLLWPPVLLHARCLRRATSSVTLPTATRSTAVCRPHTNLRRQRGFRASRDEKETDQNLFSNLLGRLRSFRRFRSACSSSALHRAHGKVRFRTGAAAVSPTVHGYVPSIRVCSVSAKPNRRFVPLYWPVSTLLSPECLLTTLHGWNSQRCFSLVALLLWLCASTSSYEVCW